MTIGKGHLRAALAGFFAAGTIVAACVNGPIDAIVCAAFAAAFWWSRNIQIDFDERATSPQKQAEIDSRATSK